MEQPRKQPGATKPQPVRRILAIKLGHIGDVLLMTPALETLRRLYPGAEISVMVRRGTEAMLRNLPLVKEVIIGADIGKKTFFLFRLTDEWRLLRRLRRECFDLVVSFSGGDRGAVIGFLCGAHQRIAYTAEGKGLWGKDKLYTHICRLPWKTTHTVLKDVQLICDFATASGISSFEDPLKSAGKLVLNPSADAIDWAGNRWRQLHNGRRPRVVIHPTSRWLFKCWDNAKVAALADQLRAECEAAVVLTTGPDQREIAKGKEILALGKNPLSAHLGDLTLDQLAALIQEADLFVGVDTAPMHVAAAVGTPVVALFGPSPDKLWSPWGDSHRVIRRRCPCIEINRITCDKSSVVKCMSEIPAEEVFAAAKEVLNR